MVGTRGFEPRPLPWRTTRLGPRNGIRLNTAVAEINRCILAWEQRLLPRWSKFAGRVAFAKRSKMCVATKHCRSTKLPRE